MADSEILSPMNILKNSLILVNVEEVLQDIIVVTYTHEGRIFQGVLLDTTKRTLPCGIIPPVVSTAQLADTQEDDKLFSLSQRFTYFQDKPIRSADHLNHNQFLLKRPIRPPARYRNANVRATPVRLRPRQVLCSKCRGICNENSENVDVSQRNKCPENSISTRSVNSRSEKLVGSSSELASSKSPRPLFSENHRDNQPKCMSPTKDAKLSPSLIPKISRLQPTEISNALIGNTNKLNIVGNYWMSPSRPSDETELNGLDEKDENDGKLYCLPVHKVLVQDTLDEASLGQVDPLGDDVCVLSGAEEPSGGMVLRKKKSVGSMEDLWDESVFEECGGVTGAKKARAARTTPVIKISFGSRGEGTVMKIPSKLRECSESDTDDRAHRNTRDASAKAAKKALKRAKREARRKMLGGASPARSFGGMSPAGGGASPAYEELYRRRHKRNKVKHKKKHKEERKHKEVSEDSEMNEDSNGNKCAGAAVISDGSLNYKDMKELCLKQKLSINLKRLNTNAYKRCEDPESNGSKSPTGSEMSDDHGETVPDFPPPGSYLDIRETVDTCITSDGRLMAIGDVVWGKILGFPWWPGKVSCITVARTEDGQTVDHEAHVRWYGSSTMSLMPCNQLYPFLETFKMRYNKKKRGPYKEAIRQATYEAQREESNQEEITHIESSKAESPPQIIDVVL